MGARFLHLACQGEGGSLPCLSVSYATAHYTFHSQLDRRFAYLLLEPGDFRA